MDYDVQALQEASKQRYLDLGIIYLPDRISGYAYSEEAELAHTAVANSVDHTGNKIASRYDCKDCGIRQEGNERHHWKSYDECDRLEVIVLCAPCHKSLHFKLAKDVFYDGTLGDSLSAYLNADISMSISLLAEIHGVSNDVVSGCCGRENISNTFWEQANISRSEKQRHPNRPSDEVLLRLTSKMFYSDVAIHLGVSERSINKWLKQIRDKE